MTDRSRLAAGGKILRGALSSVIELLGVHARQVFQVWDTQIVLPPKKASIPVAAVMSAGTVRVSSGSIRAILGAKPGLVQLAFTRFMVSVTT
jgi:hypothetical protein